MQLSLKMKPIAACSAISTTSTSKLKLLDWLGCFFGILGASMLALNFEYSALGWLSFLASNFCWVPYAYWNRIYSLMLMQMAFTVTSAVGVVRWLM